MIYVKALPTLNGKVAERIEKMVRENLEKRGSIDFSKEYEHSKAILEKRRKNN